MERPIDRGRRAFLGMAAATPSQPPAECHISSLLVHVRPERQAETATLIDALPGAETQSPHATGKLIVTLETASTMEIMDRLAVIQDMPGVIAVALVYHQWEAGSDAASLSASAAEAENEADHGSHAPHVSES